MTRQRGCRGRCIGGHAFQRPQLTLEDLSEQREGRHGSQRLGRLWVQKRCCNKLHSLKAHVILCVPRGEHPLQESGHGCGPAGRREREEGNEWGGVRAARPGEACLESQGLAAFATARPAPRVPALRSTVCGSNELTRHGKDVCPPEMRREVAGRETVECAHHLDAQISVVHGKEAHDVAEELRPQPFETVAVGIDDVGEVHISVTHAGGAGRKRGLVGREPGVVFAVFAAAPTSPPAKLCPCREALPPKNPVPNGVRRLCLHAECVPGNVSKDAHCPRVARFSHARHDLRCAAVLEKLLCWEGVQGQVDCQAGQLVRKHSRRHGNHDLPHKPNGVGFCKDRLMTARTSGEEPGSAAKVKAGTCGFSWSKRSKAPQGTGCPCGNWPMSGAEFCDAALPRPLPARAPAGVRSTATQERKPHSSSMEM